jgi:hypothetical protein
MGDEVKAAAAPQWEPWVRDGRASATTRLDRQLNSYMKAKRAKLEAV